MQVSARAGCPGINQHARLLDKRYMPNDQDAAIKNDGKTSEHIEKFGRLSAYEWAAGAVRAEVRVRPQKPRKEPKKEEKEEKEEKKPQTSLFDF
ncbi:MAG: hypothetical protein C4B59_06880 [Candidatus Methanogaster sp.]|uniref:Uncharacterized protein n=1 Tax=Candidatus Methanogaster sp. TaxID=3386292 RepID=A0AC61L3D7_9EURY|nr:MAG: hypothetical protein C4B59_06880 [ANME-2 cluster archaeon]